MECHPHQIPSQESTTLGSGQNVINPAPPVIIMVPTPAPVKQKIAYEKRFPRKLMLTLSSIQLAMAALAIISQVIGLSTRYPEAHYVGTGIWCGIFFGLSGMFGIIASCKPSFGIIVTFMVFTIIASVFCIPLLIASSISTAFSGRCWRNYCNGRELRTAMFAVQIVISLVQGVAAIASSVMTCKAICSCCRPKRESGVVYYTNDGGAAAANHVPSQPLVLPQQQPGYITIPISQIQAAAAAGATAMHTQNLLPGSTNAEAESPPPKYESVAGSEKLERFDSVDLKDDENQEANGSKYQRFE